MYCECEKSPIITSRINFPTITSRIHLVCTFTNVVFSTGLIAGINLHSVAAMSGLTQDLETFIKEMDKAEVKAELK